MTKDEMDQIVRWLQDHGFTVQVDYVNERITLKLSERPG